MMIYILLIGRKNYCFIQGCLVFGLNYTFKSSNFYPLHVGAPQLPGPGSARIYFVEFNLTRQAYCGVFTYELPFPN